MLGFPNPHQQTYRDKVSICDCTQLQELVHSPHLNLRTDYHCAVPPHTDTSPTIPHSKQFFSRTEGAAECPGLPTFKYRRTLRPGIQQLVPYWHCHIPELGLDRHTASTPRHTRMHTPQLGKTQARRPTSQADQLCPVRKRTASELTQPEALLYCSGHNRIDGASPNSKVVEKRSPLGSRGQGRGSGF